jgi:hypothetical protein
VAEQYRAGSGGLISQQGDPLSGSEAWFDPHTNDDIVELDSFEAGGQARSLVQFDDTDDEVLGFSERCRGGLAGDGEGVEGPFA